MSEEQEQDYEEYFFDLQSSLGKFRASMKDDSPGFEILRSADGTTLGLAISGGVAVGGRENVLPLSIEQSVVAAKMILEAVQEQLAKGK